MMSNGSSTASKQGFSLIEVVLALGVVSFAMVSLLALIPVGLASFKKAMSLTVEAQIVQRMSSEIGLRQYSQLASSTNFFDVQGTPTTSATDRVYTAALSFTNGLSNVKSADSLGVTTASVASIDIRSTVNPNQVRHYTIIVANNGQ